MDKPPHLLVSITAHGFGHVAQTAPVINALRRLLPDLQLTLRSAVPLSHLQSRFDGPFEYLRDAGDIGMLMSSAMDVRADASAQAYLTLHHEWGVKVGNEARMLREIAPDFVFSNVGYLALAGAHLAGIPAAAMCSLNWADIYRHYCAGISGAHHVLEEMLHAYGHAQAFLQPAPGMPMADLSNRLAIGPVAAVGQCRRDVIDRQLGLGRDERLVLVSLGGVSGRLPMEHWPRLPGVRWLVAANWHVSHPDAVVLESLELPFADLLASCDALICKPGYGSFVEAACSAVPVLYVKREDWPETPFLTAWLQQHGRARAIDRHQLESGRFGDALQALWAQPATTPVVPSGIDEAADWLAGRLLAWS